MKIAEVFRKSFELLYREPKIFIPRFITTALYTIVLIYIARVTSELTKLMAYGSGYDTAPVNPAILTSFLENITLVLASLVFLMFVDLISYAMYPALIKDHYAKKPLNLTGSLIESLKAWKVILVLGLILMAFCFVISVPVTLPELLMMENAIIYYIFASVLIGSMLILMMVLLFFIVPVAVIEKKGLLATFSEGFRLSMQHKKELLTINSIFITLTAITFLLMTLAELTYEGVYTLTSTILFILVRGVQAVMYTYISVVNPYFYMHVKTGAHKKTGTKKKSKTKKKK